MLLTRVIKAFSTWSQIKDTLETPTLAGHSFTGWSLETYNGPLVPDDHVFLEDTTIYACYDIVYITIKLDLQGGQCKINQLRVPALTDFATVKRQLAEYDVVKPGLALDYWSLVERDGTEIPPDHVFTESTTIYAYYTDDFIRVILDPQGGAIDGTSTVLTVNRFITWAELKEIVPNATKEGYTFEHWTTNLDTNAVIDDGYIFQEDIVTLFAVYEIIIINVDVIFDYDGFTETVNIATGSTLQQAIDMLDGWNKGTGYTLIGWGTNKNSQITLNTITTFITTSTTFHAVYERTFQLYLITHTNLELMYSVPTKLIGTVVLKNGESLTSIFNNSTFNNALPQTYFSLEGQICNSSGTAVNAGSNLAPGTYYVKYSDPGDTYLSLVCPAVLGNGSDIDDFLDEDFTTWYRPIDITVPFVISLSSMKSLIVSAMGRFASGSDEAPSDLTSSFDVIGVALIDQGSLESGQWTSTTRYLPLSSSRQYLASAFSQYGLIVALRYRGSVLLNQAPGTNKLKGSNFEFPYCTLKIAKNSLSSAAEAGSSGNFYVKTSNKDYDDRSDEQMMGADADIFFPTLGTQEIRALSYRAAD